MNAVASGPTVGIFGYFGNGNLGNEGSLAAFLAFVRREHPRLRLFCIAADPEAVRRDHGIPAARMMAYRGTSSEGRLGTVKKVGGRLADLPRTFILLRGVDVLVVPGTGVLEKTPDVKPWGMPYWLFLATLMCRLRGGKVALVCVGADPPRSRATRWLYRTTVSLSDHCSYRDPESREAMAVVGGDVRGEASHDLAFSLPAPTCGDAHRGRVVVGVMRYEGAPDDPGRGPERVRDYASTMVDLIRQVLATGREVVVVVGDEADRPLAAEIARSASDASSSAGRQVRVSPAASLDAIMREMDGADLVVATRFHHLVCSLKMLRPTVSIGYAVKSEHLMTRFGLGDYALRIEQVALPELWQACLDAQARSEELEPVMKDALEQVVRDLERHLRELALGELSRGRA
jgi:polysaccharide pyruvyl transferase WcaK-like protein